MIMNYYRDIDREKVQFDFVENQPGPADFDHEIHELGGRIFRCPHYNGKNHFLYKKWWKKFFDKYSDTYTAVHGHLGSTASIYLREAKKRGLYTIAHSHNTTIWDLGGIIYHIYAYPTRYIADFFFGCSMEAGVSRYGSRICHKAGRFKVLNNAIDTKNYSYNPSIRKEMREKYHLEDKLVIGHVGRFNTQKNHEYLIDIFEAVYRIEPNAMLVLVGDGELRKSIEIKVREKGLSENTIFAGIQQNVNEFYQMMDVFVFPSLYEGLGIVLVEAQTAGLPCVVSDAVTDEVILVDDLIKKLSIKITPNEWAKKVLEQRDIQREGHSLDVAQGGYDIMDNARWLQDFYLDIHT